MNATVKDFVKAIPKHDSLSPVDLAGVFGKTDGAMIIAEIRRGRIDSSRAGGQFFISYNEAVRYVESTEYKPDEA